MDLTDQIKAKLANQPSLESQILEPDLLYRELSWEIVGAAIEVHRHLGPGQLESVYEQSMLHELDLRGIAVESQVPVPMVYKGKRVGDFFADLIVEDSIILELKAVEQLKGLHSAQLWSYLAATGMRLGILMNFNVERMVYGVKRVIR